MIFFFVHVLELLLLAFEDVEIDCVNQRRGKGN